MPIQEYYQAKKETAEDNERLEQTILLDEEKLFKLEKQYTETLAIGDEAKADKISTKISETEQGIKNATKKKNTLNTINRKRIKEKAEEVIKETETLKTQTEKKGEAIIGEMQELIQQIDKKASELQKINGEYNTERRNRQKIAEKEGYGIKELGHSLYRELTRDDTRFTLFPWRDIIHHQKVIAEVIDKHGKQK